MPLLIADREVGFGTQNVPAPFTTGIVRATPTLVPLWVSTSGSESEEDQSAAREVRIDRQTGAWSLSLPWPSTCTPPGVQFNLRRSSGATFAGTVPEGVAGPLTVWDLVQLYGWGLVASSTTPAPVTAITGPAGLVWHGAWSTSTAYAVHDAVAEGGSAYVCILAHTGHRPPNATYWDLLATKGDTGATGPAGASSTPPLTTAASSTLSAAHATVLVTAQGTTQTLPTAVGCAGQVYIVKNTANGAATTVAPSGGQLIDQQATYALPAPLSAVWAQSDGATWWVL